MEWQKSLRALRSPFEALANDHGDLQHMLVVFPYGDPWEALNKIINKILKKWAHLDDGSLTGEWRPAMSRCGIFFGAANPQLAKESDPQKRQALEHARWEAGLGVIADFAQLASTAWKAIPPDQRRKLLPGLEPLKLVGGSQIPDIARCVHGDENHNAACWMAAVWELALTRPEKHPLHASKSKLPIKAAESFLSVLPVNVFEASAMAIDILAPASATMADQPVFENLPLTDGERAVLRLILDHPGGIIGKDIIAGLSPSLSVSICQSTLTARIIPRLKTLCNVTNRRNAGYYIPHPAQH